MNFKMRLSVKKQAERVRNLRIGLAIVVAVSLFMWVSDPSAGVIKMGFAMALFGLPIGISLAASTSRLNASSKASINLDEKQIAKRIRVRTAFASIHLLIGLSALFIAGFYLVGASKQVHGTSWDAMSSQLITIICVLVMAGSIAPISLAISNFKKIRALKSQIKGLNK